MDCVPACRTGYVCRSGRCELDGTAVWVVSAVRGSVAERKADGSTWDAVGGAPDPFVCVRLGGELRCTGPVQNTMRPVWNEDLLTATARTLMDSGLRVSFWDEDVTNHDSIYTEGLLSVSEPALRAGTLEGGCPLGRFELSFRLW